MSLVLVVNLSFLVACGEKKESQPETEESKGIQAKTEEAQQGGLAANIVVDPVCGMQLNKNEVSFTAEYKGQTYYFCMESEKLAFVDHPEKYVTVE
jgi:YHS domain-containing protein